MTNFRYLFLTPTQKMKKIKDSIISSSMAENIEYSFAVEYNGPPIPYEIPKAIPIEVDRIPIASIAATSASCTAGSLPVVQPLPLKNSNPSAALARNDVIVSSSELRGTAGDLASTDSSLVSDDFENNFEDDDDDDDDVVATAAAGEKRSAAIVTFRESNSSSCSFSSTSRSDPVKVLKKRSCFRCSKGSWFTEKESCLVCDAKYCSNCVLRAMGSMPEGRKCVGCIGKSIEDSKMEKLGKSSRMLKRLLSSLEVEQVMKAEKYCEANQLRAEDVCVNRKPLTLEEMVLLQSCPCPPPRLKPGYYWYDKVSGFWGKEGHKPDKIISANLNVGGNLMENASNGNTGILINGREITKVEMQMLKSAGVQCAGNPHFWVDADGSYREEGQKDVKGNIWGKTRTKLLCSFLSLPVPSKGGNPSGEEVNNMLNGPFHNFFEQRMLQKLFLVGYDGSGTSTIFKQAKFLYESSPFSEDERQSIKLLIQSSIYSYLGILLEGRERFEEETLADRKKNQPCEFSGKGDDVSGEGDDVTVYSISPRLKVFSDWLLKEMASGKLEAIFLAATREYAPTVEELWKDPAIQVTYSRRSELQSLPSSASYFLEKAVDISRVEYEPTDLDILYADGITSPNGLACTEFFFPRTASDESGNDDADQQDPLVSYQLIRLPTKGLGENCKWLDMFEDVRIVIFCVSLSDYNEYYIDASGVTVNKMMESKRLFEYIVTHHTFEHMDFLLILNKFDLLEQKIEKFSLTLCDWFNDYNPVSSRHNSNSNGSHRSRNGEATRSEKAFQYMAVKFKRLFLSRTGRKLYVTSSKGLEPESIDAALRYAREILKWEEEWRPSINEFSSYDVSSTDH